MDERFLAQVRSLAAAGRAQDLAFDAVVARVAVDRFCSLEQPSATDIERFSALALSALDKADAASAARIAEKLAPNPHAPEKVLSKLIRRGETAAVAILHMAPHLSADLLLSRAEIGSGAEAAAIAARTDLDRSVVAALARRPESEALRALATNPAITIERGALTALIQRGRFDLMLGQALLARADFDAGALPLFLAADAQTRRQLILEARRAEFAAPAPTTSPLEAARHAMIAAAEAVNRAAFAAAVAMKLRTGRAAVERMIDDPGGEPAALLLAATGAGAGVVGDALAMLRPDLPTGAQTGVRLAIETGSATAYRIVAAVVHGRTSGSATASEYASRAADEFDAPRTRFRAPGETSRRFSRG